MSVRTRLVAAALIGGVFAACASAPKPEAELARARTLVEQAEQSGAQRYAAADLDQARGKLQQADAASKEGKNDEARRLAVEAGVDAQLAAARTSSGEAKKSADEVQRSVETLRQEANRGQQTPASTPPSSPNQ